MRRGVLRIPPAMARVLRGGRSIRIGNGLVSRSGMGGTVVSSAQQEVRARAVVVAVRVNGTIVGSPTSEPQTPSLLTYDVRVIDGPPLGVLGLVTDIAPSPNWRPVRDDTVAIWPAVVGDPCEMIAYPEDLAVVRWHLRVGEAISFGTCPPPA